MPNQPHPQAVGDTIWPALRQRLLEVLEPEEHLLWIDPLAVAEAGPGRMLLACPNAFHLRWVRDNHLAAIKGLAGPVEISLTVNTEAPTVHATPQGVDKSAPIVNTPGPSLPNGGGPRQLDLPRLTGGLPRLNARFRFETFVAGAGNEFALAAAQALAQGQRLVSNTLFLVSDTGLGKSHLAQAVGRQVLTDLPGRRVAYLTAEDFANQMISALRNKRIDDFKDRFRRGCDLLLLEEVQFLAGKDKTQDELGYTLDALLDAGKRVVFTGQQAPERIKGLKPHLASRLGCGLTAPIEAPDLPTRVRILQALAQVQGTSVDLQVLECLAERRTQDVRRLQSALIGLLAKASLTRRPLDLSLAEEVLGQLASDLRRLTPERIRDQVAQVYGLTSAVLTGRSRRQSITRPRNLALYLCRRHTEASYAELGRFFNRDHSTVMYGVDQMERALAVEPRLSQEIAFLEQRLGVGR
ncbi:MAG: chromosomal replication initiator protein DnaA [Desulfarculus sp.]|nr:chromosomal replication initiator protein DnaA [Desulfarculus sp.]